MKNNLVYCRKEIDKINKEIFNLILKRIEIGRIIFKLKEKSGLKKIDKKREEDILAKIKKISEEREIDKKLTVKIFKDIIELTKKEMR